MAGPARTATPLPARIGQTKTKTYQQMLNSRSDGEETRMRGLIGKAFDGKLNNTGTLTLSAGPATTTDIDDLRIGPSTIALLVGLDQNGSASLPSVSQAVVQPGKIRLTHAASALTRTIGFALFGCLIACLLVGEASAQSPSLFGIPYSSDPACAAGEYWFSVNSSGTVWRKCQNGTITDLDTGGGGGAPDTVDYLVGTADGGLSAEIVVGTTPGGELGGTWASPTIDSLAVSFSELDGTAVDSQIPNNITIDLATTATTANAGDSATAFFSSGTLEDARIDGSLEADEVNPTLGTQTQGNYVASVATTAPLSGGAAGSEGGALTLTISQNLGTDVTADLEEEAHCAEHDSADVNCSGETIVLADDVVGFAEIDYSQTRAGNPAMNAEECVFSTDGTSGGGILCEGTTADAFEQLYKIPAVDGSDAESFFATAGSAITDALSSATAALIYQPLDADLTSIAALTTTAHGRGLLDDADAAASRTSIDAQQLDGDLTSIAALTTTAHGRGLLDDADAAASRTSIGAQAASSELDNLINNCVIENDATPIPDSCVGDGSDAGGGGSPGGSTTEVQFNNASAFDGADRLTFASSTAGAAFGAGTATAGTWPTIASGTVLTTAEDGAIEVDADAFYLTTDAGNRGNVPVEYIIRADATRTFTSNTSQQAIFTTPANGRITLEAGTYLFDGIIAMTSMSGTSGNGKFSILGAGTATLGSILWRATGQDVAAEGTAGAQGGGWHVIATQTAANVATAATGTALAFTVDGTFEVTGAGTVIPSFAQTTAAAAVVSIGSHIRIRRIGSTSMTNVGQWD